MVRKQIAGPVVNVVVFEQVFDSPERVIRCVKEELPGFSGKKVVFLFPECFLGRYAISRKTGKELAARLSTLLQEHGNAYVAYSVLESAERNRKPGSQPVITNSGYLVFPKAKDRFGYKVYPKIYTGNQGRNITAFDKDNLFFNRVDETIGIKQILALARRIKSFPRIKIGKITAELRVCADAIKTRGTDFHPARRKRNRTQLVLIPACDLPPKSSFLDGVAKLLAIGGIGVIADSVAGTSIITKKLGRAYKRRIFPALPFKKGKFAVHPR